MPGGPAATSCRSDVAGPSSGSNHKCQSLLAAPGLLFGIRTSCPPYCFFALSLILRLGQFVAKVARQNSWRQVQSPVCACCQTERNSPAGAGDGRAVAAPQQLCGAGTGGGTDKCRRIHSAPCLRPTDVRTVQAILEAHWSRWDDSR